VKEKGGRAALFVPGFWKSAQRLRALELRFTDQPSFWERHSF
jgi:DMSO/TMAO reductase YedYZ molybdopterin-dependent catalytic subunit